VAQLDWFNNPFSPGSPASPNPNPCIALYGAGPLNTQCRRCVHLRYPLERGGMRHWKCDLRILSHGSATDHHVRWPACARYEEREGEYHGG
jgi:hypothetical protein